jgi:beta-aspartyl-peptidase (threonine type)
VLIILGFLVLLALIAVSVYIRRARENFLRETAAQAANRKAEEAAAIRQVLDDQVTAWNKRDLDGFMAGYWNSPDLRFFSAKGVRRGWQTLYDRYRQDYQAEGKEMGTLAFSDLDIDVLGPDSALVRGRWQLVMGDKKPGGLFTLVFKKLPEGWRIVHDHTSEDQSG